MFHFACKSLSAFTALVLFAASTIANAQNLIVDNYFDNSAYEFSPNGTDLGLLTSSNGIYRFGGMAFNNTGLYIAGQDSSVRRFSPTGQDLGVFASGFSGAGGIAFDAADNVYIGDRGQNEIREFSATGTDLGVFASTGLADPTGLAFDSRGNLYAANFLGSTVREFSSTGIDLGDFATGLSNPGDLVFRPSPAAVPEPNALALMTSAVVCGAGLLARRRRK